MIKKLSIEIFGELDENMIEYLSDPAIYPNLYKHPKTYKIIKNFDYI